MLLFFKWKKRSVLPFCVSYKLALAMDPCHPPLQGLNQVLLQLLTFIISWKKFRVSRNEALFAWGKTGRTGLQISWILSGANFMSPILASSPVYKSTKNPSKWYLLLVTSCKCSWEEQKPSVKKIRLDRTCHPFTKSTRILTFPTPTLHFWSSFSELSEILSPKQ